MKSSIRADRLQNKAAFEVAPIFKRSFVNPILGFGYFQILMCRWSCLKKNDDLHKHRIIGSFVRFKTHSRILCTPKNLQFWPHFSLKSVAFLLKQTQQIFLFSQKLKRIAEWSLCLRYLKKIIFRVGFRFKTKFSLFLELSMKKSSLRWRVEKRAIVWEKS